MLNLAFFAIFTIATVAQATDSCEQPGRNTALCYRMKTLRTQVHLLDTQRELMQVRFDVLLSIGSDIDVLTQKILTSSRPDDHLEALSLVQQSAKDLTLFAQDRSIQTLNVANALKTQCLKCHGGDQPSSGIHWGEISRQSWEQITPRCNTAGRNPWTCRNMHALGGALAYFEAAQLAGHRRFEATESQLEEMLRVSELLSEHEAVHGGSVVLRDLSQNLTILLTQARERKTEVYAGISHLAETCQRCHTPDPLRFSALKNSPQTTKNSRPLIRWILGD
jgi:hypothetical protein